MLKITKFCTKVGKEEIYYKRNYVMTKTEGYYITLTKLVLISFIFLSVLKVIMQCHTG